MPVQVIDLFCGIGGLTKGLELANLHVVAGVDINEHCRFAYEANTNACFIQGDVADMNGGELLQFLSQEAICVLVGCAPCQPFSQYTQRYRKTGYKDDKWKLLYSFLNLVDTIHPSVVSMENVPELYNERIFMDFVQHLKNSGYHCSWSTVYCPDYGVPQKRKRLVLLASKFGEINMIPAQYSPNNYRTVRDAIGNLPHLRDGESEPEDIMHCSAKLSRINLERIRQSAPGGTWHEWDEHLKLSCHKKETGKSYSSVYGRMIWDAPSPTITTKFYGYGNGRFGHPEQDRALSYREGALLQSFPPDYIFFDKHHPLSKRELGIHIGNAVPVELSRAIGLSIVQHLNDMGVNQG